MNYTYKECIENSKTLHLSKTDPTISIDGIIKYDLLNKKEYISLQQDNIKKSLYEETLPLGYSFIELMNIDTTSIEKINNKLMNLKILKNNNMKFSKYSAIFYKKHIEKLKPHFPEYQSIRTPIISQIKVAHEDVKLINEKYKYDFITDIRPLKNLIYEYLKEIIYIHPYLISDNCTNNYIFNFKELENPKITYSEEQKITAMYECWEEIIEKLYNLISHIFHNISVIENYRKYIDFCLNTNRNDDWDDIPLRTRLYIFDKFYRENISQSQILSGNPIKLMPDINIRDKSEKLKAIEKDINNQYKPDIKILKEVYKDCSIYIGDETPLADIENLCLISIINMVKTETPIKKCANCNKYFIPLNRSDTIYCDRIAPQNNKKTCKKYGAEKQYKTNLKNDETAYKYRQVYMKLQMLIKRNPSIDSYKIKFEKFKTDSKQWKLDVKNGIKARKEYLEWLSTY